MSEWNPEGEQPEGESGEGGSSQSVVRVLTTAPVRLRLVATEHAQRPEGHTVFRTLGALAGAITDESPVLAQGSLPEEIFAAVESTAMFAEPRPLLLTAHEEDGGVRATLSAIVPTDALERLERAGRASSEPWLASVPETSEPFAAGAAGEDGTPDESTTSAAPFVLGLVLRFPENRKHPNDLASEAVDLLGTLLSGGAMDADQKRIDNLLQSL